MSPAFADETPQETTPEENSEETPTDETPEAEFSGAVGYGFAVAMSTDGSTAVVGQLGESQSTDVPGVAHVLTFDGTGWSQQAELTASDPKYDMLFGNAVAVSADGNTVIVGDPGECGYELGNCEHGVAYVFTRSGSTWTQQEELQGGAGFGGAVALSADGDTALVGAGLSGFYGLSYAIGGNAPPTIFSRSGGTWTQEATLSASDASGSFDNFGHAVALSADGETALIGDPAENEDTGSAYVFTGTGSTWTQRTELTGSDVKKGWEFGTSVALSADAQAALIGAPSSSGGSAYVFRDSESNWSQTAELTPEGAEVSSFDGWFGRTVALDNAGDVALVGAPWAEEDLGAAYAFATDGTGWTPQAEFVVGDATPYDYFGDAVALDGSGTTALIGREDPGAYFFGVPIAEATEPPVGKSPTKVGGTETKTDIPEAHAGPDAASETAQGFDSTKGGTGAPGPVPISVEMSGETLAPRAFAAAPRGASAIDARRRAYGASVAYTLAAAGKVRFTIAKLQPGRESASGHCVKLAAVNLGARVCTRAVLLPGDFTVAGDSGVNRFLFTGRLDGHKLAVGSYRLLATPVAADGVGRAVSFRIVR
jgi:hypothetical protein